MLPQAGVGFTKLGTYFRAAAARQTKKGREKNSIAKERNEIT